MVVVVGESSVNNSSLRLHNQKQDDWIWFLKHKIRLTRQWDFCHTNNLNLFLFKHMLPPPSEMHTAPARRGCPPQLISGRNVKSGQFPEELSWVGSKRWWVDWACSKDSLCCSLDGLHVHTMSTMFQMTGRLDARICEGLHEVADDG